MNGTLRDSSAQLAWALVLIGVAMGTAGKAPAQDSFVPLRLGEVMPEGWLRATLERDLVTGYAGHLDELLQDPVSKEPLLLPENNDFVTRANSKDSRHDDQGLSIPPGPHSWWHGEMIGDWHDSLIRAAYLTGEPTARKKADRFVEAVLNSQDEDGYIGIYPKGYRFHFSGPDAELWTQRCVLLGLLAYYEFTGREDVLDAVERSVKLTISQYGSGTENYFDNPGQIGSGVAHGLMYLDVLEWLHRLTGDEDYRSAVFLLYDAYDTATRVKNQDAQLARLLDPSDPLSGHGPDVMGFLRVPLLCHDLARENLSGENLARENLSGENLSGENLSGENVYWRAWENAIRKTERHLGVGGSPLSGQMEEIAKESQTPGMPYEYCSTFYLLHSLTWAMQKTGNARYGDMFERTLFNAAQGARFANGKALTYYSADERLWVRQKPPEGRGNRRYIYTAAFYPSCCHDSGARVYPYAISASWMRSRALDRDGLVATLYGPSRVATTINGTSVSILEKTSYPFSYDIEFVITTDRPVEFPLRLRIPSWSASPVVNIHDATIARDERGFLVVSKTWKTGDRVHLTLKPTIHGRTAINGTTAVAYGPLVFCLPIRETKEVVEQFPEVAGVQDFRGYQYDPEDLDFAKRSLRLKGKESGFGFRVVETPEADLQYPWDLPVLSLQGPMLREDDSVESVELLPMGSTLLRRTCFPVVND